MSAAERSPADKAVDEWQARIVASAPRLTPEQSALITRLTRRNVQQAPVKADAAATKQNDAPSPRRAA